MVNKIGFFETEDNEYEEILKDSIEEADDTAGEAPAKSSFRADDPAMIYLKEMGAVPLLTGEGEVAIAKKIAVGKERISKSIFTMPFVIEEVLVYADLLKKKNAQIKEFVLFGEESTNREEKKVISTFVKSAKELKKLYDRRISCLKKLENKRLGKANVQKSIKHFIAIRNEIINILCGLHIREEKIDSFHEHFLI